MDEAKVIEETKKRVPAMASAEIVVEPINKGGSDRTYARLKCEGSPPLIFMSYTDARPDNAAFLDASEFLANAGVSVPKIVAKDLEQMFLWIEDLGADDLWAHRNDPWESRGELYRKTLAEAAKIHRLDSASFELQPPFDETLYYWEQEYFANEYLGRFLGVPTSEIAALLEGKELRQLRGVLSVLPRSLVHRDFQSENVMVRNGEVYFIDFQGLRLGRREYDVASLLFDPYVPMEEAEREELLYHYAGLVEIEEEHLKFWLEIVDRCAAQRLMQALGAYGFLGVGKGKEEFLKHIPVAHERLMGVLEKLRLNGVIKLMQKGC